MTESRLVQAIKAGDRTAFRELYETTKARVFNVCLSYLQNREEAEEVTQDVYVKAYQSIGTFRSDSSLTTWLYRIALNTCKDALRHRQRQKRMGFLISLFKNESSDLRIDIPHFEHPGVVVENQEKAKLLFTVINRLAEQQKKAFILSQIEELSQKEIAAILQLSEKAVESLIQRAKANLRKELEMLNPNRMKGE